MPDAPEPTPSPNEFESVPVNAAGSSTAMDRGEAAGPQKPLLIFDGDCGFCRTVTISALIGEFRPAPKSDINVWDAKGFCQ
jgi:hypothetical protein